MANEIELMKKQIRDNIQLLIDDNKLDESMSLIDEYCKINSEDIEIYSMRAVIYIMQGNMNAAKKVLKEGLAIDGENFDLNYNLGYLYEQAEKFNRAVKHYEKALENCKDENIKTEITTVVEKITSEHDIVSVEDKKKIVFFVKQGMDSFLGDIINGLSDEYETKKIIVIDYKQIDAGMQWADICWFEWCDELVAYGSKHRLAGEKKIICRLHRYEAFTNHIENVKWENIDKVIFVSEHIRDIVINKTNLPYDKGEIVYNGINLSKFKFYERKKGFNLAWIGYLNLRKNPMLVIQYFNELVKMDKRYKLFIAGSFQDDTLYYYLKDIISKLNINNNIQFDGFIPNDNMSDWLKDKNYIVTGSIAEGHPVGVMEAMASGLKPVIHYFPGCEKFYPKQYIYKQLSDFIKIINEKEYNSKEYSNYIKNKYSQSKQINKIFDIFSEIAGESVKYHKNNNAEYVQKEIKSDVKDSHVIEYYNNFLSYLKRDRENENPRHTYLKNRLKEIVKKEDKVLDLGCGIGITTEYISTLGVNKVIGVDLSPELINHAKKTVKDIEFIVHDITNFYINEKFDVISLCDVIEHVPREKYNSLFEVIKNHLKVDGTVFISIPDNEYQNFVRIYRPELLQIIDNSISYVEIEELCNNSELKIRFFNSYGVFLSNQYNEYVLCNKSNYVSMWNSLKK